MREERVHPPWEVGEGSEVQEHHSDDDDDDEDYNEEEEEEEDEGRSKRSKKEGNVEERKAANEDPIDVKRYIDLKNPYFVTVIQALRSSYLYVPRSVLINYELKLPQAILFHDPTGRTWRGTVKVWTDSRTWITGWGALCRHTNLKKNDRCICKLLEENEVAGCIIKVHIIGGNST